MSPQKTHTPLFKRRALLLALTSSAFGLSITLSPASAQGVPVIDAASLAQTVLGVSQRAQQIAHMISQVNQGIQHLMQLPGELLSQTTGVLGAGQALSSLRELYGSVQGLMQAGQNVQRLYSRAEYEMDALRMNPAQWAQAYLNLAQSRGGIYQQQLTQDVATMNGFATRAQALQRLSAEIPGVSGSVQGLQLLNQQANAIATDMMQLRSVLTRQAMLDTQELQAKQDSDARWAEATIAQIQLADKNAQRSRDALNSIPRLNFQ